MSDTYRNKLLEQESCSERQKELSTKMTAGKRYIERYEWVTDLLEEQSLYFKAGGGAEAFKKKSSQKSRELFNIFLEYNDQSPDEKDESGLIEKVKEILDRSLQGQDYQINPFLREDHLGTQTRRYDATNAATPNFMSSVRKTGSREVTGLFFRYLANSGRLLKQEKEDDRPNNFLKKVVGEKDRYLPAEFADTVGMSLAAGAGFTAIPIPSLSILNKPALEHCLAYGFCLNMTEEDKTGVLHVIRAAKRSYEVGRRTRRERPEKTLAALAKYGIEFTPEELEEYELTGLNKVEVSGAGASAD